MLKNTCMICDKKIVTKRELCNDCHEAQLIEFKKCKSSPYYFMKKYWKVNGKAFKTSLSEEEFNNQFKKVSKETQELEINRELLITKTKEFFDEYGKEITINNGKSLPVEKKEPEYSKNIYVLLDTGIHEAYFSKTTSIFMVNRNLFFYKNIKSCNMESNKFITKRQLKQLEPLIKDLKIK